LLLDGDGEPEDIDNVVNESALDQSAEFGDWGPDGLFFLPLRAFSALLVASAAESSLLTFGFWCLYFRSLLSHKLNNIMMKIKK
jgi:hypothetical protein